MVDIIAYTDCKIHGANMGPIWGLQDPGGPHGGPMNLAIWTVHQFLVEDISEFEKMSIR